MSIANEITRIRAAKEAIKSAINAKGGTLTDELLDQYAGAIAALPSGSSIDLTGVTVTADGLLEGVVAVNGAGDKVTGNIKTVIAALSANMVTVPKGYIAEEQTLTVAEAKAPEVDGNVVTIYPGYVATEQTVTVETPGDDVNWSEVTATASDIRQGTAIVTESGVLNGTLPTRLNSDVIVNGNQVAFPYGIYDSSYSVSVGTAKAAETITPGTVDQTIPADTYLSGDLTVKGDANLVPENIAAGVTVFGVEGIRSGDGGGEIVEYGYIDANGLFQGIDLFGDAPADVGTAENVDLKMFLTGKPLPENSVTLDLSFITATASDILAGKLGTDVNGKPVNGAIQTVTASLSRNTVTVPMGYIAEEQTLTVAEMDEPSLSGNVVTIPVGYNKYQLKYSVGTAKAAATITPGTVDQTIPAKTYLTGDLTVKGDADLLPENIINGKTIFGVTGTHKTDYSMDAYKCAAVHGLYEKECVIIQDPIHNGFYTGVYELSKSRYTTDENGNKQYAYVHGQETAPGIWHNWYYHYNEFDKKWGVSKDEFNPEKGLEYYGSIGTSWTDKEDNVLETMSCEAAVITKIDPNAYHTWDGYKATLGEDGFYTFEENLTTGLTYGTSYPETGKIYSADGTMEIKPAPFGNMTEGLVFYASLQGGISSAGIGGKLINNGAVAEEYGADFTGNAVIMPEKNISIGTRDDSDFTLIFEENIYDCADNTAVYPIRIGNDAWDQFLPHIEKIDNGAFLVFPSVTDENGRHLKEISFDVWHNVAVVRQNKRYYYSIYGNALSYIDYAQGISDPKLYIGSCNENGTDGFNGRIKNILIYDRALTPEEINFLENRDDSACNRDKPFVYTVSGADEEEYNGDYWENGNIYNGRKVYINKHARAIYFYDGRWRFDYPPNDTFVSLNSYYCRNSISNGKTPTEGEWIKYNGEKIGLTVTEYQG